MIGVIAAAAAVIIAAVVIGIVISRKNSVSGRDISVFDAKGNITVDRNGKTINAAKNMKGYSKVKLSPILLTIYLISFLAEL